VPLPSSFHEFVPKQTARPFVVTPQVWLLPAASDENAKPSPTSTGGVKPPVIPYATAQPQQSAVPVVVSAQVCSEPVTTERMV
jgi:hypothetical protein